MVSPTWSGSIDEGHSLLSEFSTLATPLAADISLTSPLAELWKLDGMFAAGAHYAIGTCNIGLLTLVAAAMII